MAKPRRSIAREHLFEDALAGLVGDAALADEFISAAESVLAFEPEMGTQNENGLWMLPMSSIDGRDVWLFYTFDDSTVTFVFIESY